MQRTEPTVGDGMPTFARPLAGRTPPPAAPKSSVFSSARPVVSLVTLSCAATFLLARPNGAESLSAAKAGPAAHQHAAQKTKPAAKAAADSTDDRQGIDFYTNNVRGGMFSAPQPPRPTPPPTPVVKVVKPAPPIKIPPMVIDPFADWTYSGTVHMGDITMALLENSRTREGQYVKSGDMFMGSKVQSISDQQVTLMNAGKPAMLAKADTIVITPLNQNAPAANPAQPGGQPGQQPGQMQAMQATQTDNSQLSFTLPNGRVLTGDRAARYKQRLDSGFGGGGFGGGGGGRRRGGNGGGAMPFGG